jgi:hypothetical protein
MTYADKSIYDLSKVDHVIRQYNRESGFPRQLFESLPYRILKILSSSLGAEIRS